MQILNAAQTEQALPYAKLVPAIADAARQAAAEQIQAPERQVVPINPSSVLLCMPAVGPDIGITKLITVHLDNAQRSLPAIQGEMTVFDSATGKRLALLDAPTVTARRTAAVTLLGIQHLAHAKPTSALLIGTGVQASAHVDALASYFGITDFRIAGRNPVKTGELCNTVSSARPDITARPITLDALPAECGHTDLVIALTTATMPIIPAQLSAHTLAIGVGAFKPEMAELPAELLHARPVVVDYLAGARHEAGDLIRAELDWSGVRDLASVMAQPLDKTGPTPVLKTVGHSAWDLAAGRVAIDAIG